MVLNGVFLIYDDNMLKANLHIIKEKCCTKLCNCFSASYFFWAGVELCCYLVANVQRPGPGSWSEDWEPLCKKNKDVSLYFIRPTTFSSQFSVV